MDTTRTTELRSLLDQAAFAARAGYEEGGVPIGAAIALADGTVVGASANRRAQDHDQTAHAEISAARLAGIDVDLRGATLATTLIPCWMCAGMIDHLGITTVVVGDDTSWPDLTIDWLRTRGVEVILMDETPTRALLADWIAAHADDWRPREPDA